MQWTAKASEFDTLSIHPRKPLESLLFLCFFSGIHHRLSDTDTKVLLVFALSPTCCLPQWPSHRLANCKRNIRKSMLHFMNHKLQRVFWKKRSCWTFHTATSWSWKLDFCFWVKQPLPAVDFALHSHFKREHAWFCSPNTQFQGNSNKLVPDLLWFRK